MTRAARPDITLAFLGYYIGLLFVRAFWRGDHSTASSGTVSAEPVPAHLHVRYDATAFCKT